jgi:hypothetical protein
MQATNGVIQPGDIGGPMSIGSGYRWNVPVVTYGFDQSFINYFGTNGVAAVQGAIQVLNNLPPASQIVLTNYPIDSQGDNFAAAVLYLYDLKSDTLSLLLEHMGLAEPTRNIFVLKQWNPVFTNYPSESQWPAGTIPNYIVEDNFDPQTFSASDYVNYTLYIGYVFTQNNQHGTTPYIVDLFQESDNAVADFPQVVGVYYTGLTYDDVGGLAYLLSTNNVNYENLLSGVSGTGKNSNSFVHGAWRPGVDKITFIPQPVNLQSGAFLPMTNYYTDSYLTNGIGIPEVPFYSRTGTTDWLNNAVANGNTNGAGPGVIQPQVQIVFNKLGLVFNGGGNLPDEASLDNESTLQSFGSFDGSTNAPVIYPSSQAATNQLTVRMWLEMGTYPNWSTTSFAWKPTSAAGVQFTMQTSTNLTSWVNLFTIPNNGSVCTYFNNNPQSPGRFYRLIQQQ